MGWVSLDQSAAPDGKSTWHRSLSPELAKRKLKSLHSSHSATAPFLLLSLTWSMVPMYLLRCDLWHWQTYHSTSITISSALVPHEEERAPSASISTAVPIYSVMPAFTALKQEVPISALAIYNIRRIMLEQEPPLLDVSLLTMAFKFLPVPEPRAPIMNISVYLSSSAQVYVSQINSVCVSSALHSYSLILLPLLCWFTAEVFFLGIPLCLLSQSRKGNKRKG